MGPLWREILIYRAFSQISYKILLNKNFFSKTLKKDRPSMFPKSRAPIEADGHFQSTNVTFRVLRKGALPPGPLLGVPQRERERCPIAETLHISFKVPSI
jgi:hypothetical protein